MSSALRVVPERPAPEVRSPTVLVVDDLVALRRFIGRLLRHHGYRVREAHDGAEALEVVEEEQQALLCIFLDLSMPGMDGAEMLRRLRRAGKTVPVVLMTGYSVYEATLSVGDDPLTGVLTKPFTSEKLLEALHEALRGIQPTSVYGHQVG